jgi:hypothetical protein
MTRNLIVDDEAQEEAERQAAFYVERAGTKSCARGARTLPRRHRLTKSRVPRNRLDGLRVPIVRRLMAWSRPLGSVVATSCHAFGDRISDENDGLQPAVIWLRNV